MYRSKIDPKFERASRIVERGRFCRNLARLRRTVGPLMQNLRAEGTISAAFPLLGVFDALKQRGAFEPSAFRKDVGLWRRLRSRVGAWFLDACRRWLSRHLYARFPDRPGWNDYLMVLWFMTGDSRVAERIYSRAVAVVPAGSPQMAYATGASCRWMVSSVRSQHPDFDLAIARLEAHYGLPVASLLPAPPAEMDAEFVIRALPPGTCSRCGCAIDSRDLCNCPCHVLPRPA